MIPASNGDASWLILGWLLAAWGWGWAARQLIRQFGSSVGEGKVGFSGSSVFSSTPVAPSAGDGRVAWPWLPLLVASVALIVLWQLRAGTLPGLSLHLLGAMLCTLVLGPALAVLPLSLALLSVSVASSVHGAAWSVVGLNACLLVFWPIGLSMALTRLVARLPSNIFVFIFVGGFFSSAVVVLLTGWLLALVLWAMQFYPWEGMLADFAAYWLLVAFAEAWFTGMLLTVLVIYRPERVALFDAGRYIDRA